MRVVLDANVLVSGLLSSKGPPGKILDAWLEGQFRLCLSPQILQEIQCVLEYPHIQGRLAEGQSQGLLAGLQKISLGVEGMLALDILTRDPSDNIYLACAVEAEADYLVSGNLVHFEEAGELFRGVRILSPRQFLDILSTSGE